MKNQEAKSREPVCSAAQEVELGCEISLMPVAPLGFFNDIYEEEYIREDNLFAKHSVIEVDPDIE